MFYGIAIFFLGQIKKMGSPYRFGPMKTMRKELFWRIQPALYGIVMFLTYHLIPSQELIRKTRKWLTYTDSGYINNTLTHFGVYLILRLMKRILPDKAKLNDKLSENLSY